MIKPNPEIAALMSTMPVTDQGNLACPFCGGVKLSRISKRDDLLVFWIQCDQCGATGPNLKSDITWNVRAYGEHLYFRQQDAKAVEEVFAPKS
jgi:predicted RNA-binding Zn-ribbon protein involved in translation (DUF1610 family)